ncbi:MAG: hypothetical protein COU90_03120 [Candidatus Ryanbacteria bacterium CG10_big_fil_rev_8_21_14_0_10_43_42]|uniref:Uncharacterized protein n=1 Tax=Candidatus Ryanbacteria bacterium CG10_big_fil_rev_8_21_14_0_10_43_42 TaxID=1974864 RepID=A0A2M8KX01_9BACT|nr:MAG: hypothetical protein COU90_03120 [Candidatus Ryanbacteria bacterium CG10_big_fil_rev_8_21_14_0_10_43_42]
MPTWIIFVKIFDIITILLVSASVVWLFATYNEEFSRTPFFLGIFVLAARGLVVGSLYYRDIRKTWNKSVFDAIASTILILRFPFYSNVYFREREKDLKNRSSVKSEDSYGL